jgi:hypothetical protein
VLKYAFFAAMVATAVGVYTAVVGPSLGRLKLESTEKLLIPLMVISALVSLPTYAALRRDNRLPVQILTLYCGFVLTCLTYGGFMWFSGSDGTPMFLFTALFAGHFLGLPLLLMLVGVHLVLRRLGLYRVEE